MKEILIDCSKIGSAAELHEIFARELHFPDCYGRNLDALHDCLTALREETRLELLHFTALPFPYTGLLRVLRDSEQENPRLEISFITN